MKVRATQRGHYGNQLREPDSEFDIKDDVPGQPSAFSKVWMEKVEESSEEAPADEVVVDTPLTLEQLAALTNSQLEALCDEASIDRTGVTLKADLVALIIPPAAAQTD